MTLQDYNAALARVAELKAQLAEAEKAVEEALPTAEIGGGAFRLNGEAIQARDSNGNWHLRNVVPMTLSQLRAMADAFLPERKMECNVIGYMVADNEDEISDGPSSKEDAANLAKKWNKQYPNLAPHRVVGLVEVE